MALKRAEVLNSNRDNYNIYFSYNDKKINLDIEAIK